MNRTELFEFFTEKTGKSLTQMKRYLSELGEKSPYSDNILEKLLELSEAKDNQQVWNKGISWGEETKQKIAESKKGSTPWNKGKIGVQVAWNKGISLSEEEKQKISVTLTKYYETHDNPFKGKTHSTQCRMRMAESHLGKSLSEENKKHISESLKDFYSTAEGQKKRQEYREREQKKYSSIKEENVGITTGDFCKKYPDALSTTQLVRRIHHAHIMPIRTVSNIDFYDENELLELKRLSGTSLPEQELQEYVKSLVDDVRCNDRTIIAPLELDVFVPSKNLAIEFDGLFWHSVDEGASKEEINRHLFKTLECEKKGIRLMHIFEDEWYDKKEIVKSMIASALGIYQRKIPARKCEVRKIDGKVALDFIQHNHIQNCDQILNCAYGLFYKDELVQVMTFRRNFAQRNDKDLELARMCSLLNTEVQGGFSKLMKHALEDLGERKCSSFVDRRLFNAYGYKNSGWAIVGESAPRYFYTDGRVRENRQKYMKQTCLKRWPEYDEGWTEEKMCYDKGLRRIYDCGCIKVEFSI